MRAIWTKRLVENGVTVVSGLTGGIDRVAHQTALSGAGNTIAVLGAALNKSYSGSNQRLFEQLARGQLVISQFPSSSPDGSTNFSMANRTMALISHATIIIEAWEKSGAVDQGWEALRLGRPLYLAEHLVEERGLLWPLSMLNYGAQLLTRDNMEELFYTLPSGIPESEYLTEFVF